MYAQKLSFDYAHTLHTVRIVHNAHSVHRSRVEKGQSCDCINFVRATDHNYRTGASFIYYLNDTYGERKIIDYICDNHDLTTFTDKTYDELVEDWKNYIEEKYSGYSKNK